MKPKPILLYVVYFMMTLVFFAIALFPEKQAAKEISNFVNQTLNGVHLDMERAGLKFPAGLELMDSEWTGFHSIRIKPEKMRVGFSFPSIFKPLKDMTFRATINQGEVKGNIRQASFSPNDFASLDMDLSGMQVRNFPYGTDQYQMKLSFDVGGHYEYLKKPVSSKGRLVLLNFAADLPDNPSAQKLGLSKIEFIRVELEFATDNKKMILSKCSARGPVMNVDLEGDLMLDDTGGIQLKGYLNPGPSFVSKLSTMASVKDLFRETKGKGIPITLSGTLLHPEIGFR